MRACLEPVRLGLSVEQQAVGSPVTQCARRWQHARLCTMECCSTLVSLCVLPHRVRWENPFGGTCDDTFELSSDNSTLTQHTDMVMADTGQQVKYK